MNMTHGDLILRLDKIQGGDNGVSCPRDREHGRLLPMLDGSTLICGMCGFRQAVKLEGE